MKEAARRTIFALSSGLPPAAIGVVRISGPEAGAALSALAGTIPPERKASLRTLHDPATGDELDRALVLWFPGPDTSTGEDLAELHLHGGRAVVAAVQGVLAGLDGLRPAEAGEFARRAFENGRIDLAEAEGLADLLAAETQSQRRAAVMLAGGALGRMVGAWQARLLGLAADLEARLDFSDEDDVEEALPEGWRTDVSGLAADLGSVIERPPVDRLKDGVRVVIAGPPNAGKSSLINAIVGREAAITSEVAGTTRDRIEVPVSIQGIPLLFIDTAGLRESEDQVEAIGVNRARASIADSDILLWMGDPAERFEREVIAVASKADLQPLAPGADMIVSSRTGQGLTELVAAILEKARQLLPADGEVAINARHRAVLSACRDHLVAGAAAPDPLLAAEELRLARVELDRITGRGGVEAMLDSLFGAFCIGK